MVWAIICVLVAVALASLAGLCTVGMFLYWKKPGQVLDWLVAGALIGWMGCGLASWTAMYVVGLQSWLVDALAIVLGILGALTLVLSMAAVVYRDPV